MCLVAVLEDFGRMNKRRTPDRKGQSEVVSNVLLTFVAIIGVFLFAGIVWIIITGKFDFAIVNAKVTIDKPLGGTEPKAYLEITIMNTGGQALPSIRAEILGGGARELLGADEVLESGRERTFRVDDICDLDDLVGRVSVTIVVRAYDSQGAADSKVDKSVEASIVRRA